VSGGTGGYDTARSSLDLSGIRRGLQQTQAKAWCCLSPKEQM
jgi:hypothetical protein